MRNDASLWLLLQEYKKLSIKYPHVIRTNKMHIFSINDLIQLTCLRHVSNNQMFNLTKVCTCSFMVFYYASVYAVRSTSGCVWFCLLLVPIAHVYHNARFKKRKAVSTHIICRQNFPYTSDDTQLDVLWQAPRRRSSRTLNRIQCQTPNYEVGWHNARWSHIRRAGWFAVVSYWISEETKT